MLLGQVFNSMASWKALAAVQMQPQMAYRVLKWAKLVTNEYEIIEKQRVALLYEVSGVAVGQDVKLEPDTPEVAEYLEKFNEVLQVESSLAPFPMSLDEIMAVVRDDERNLLSVADLAALEAFFFDEHVTDDPPPVAGRIG